MTVSSKLLTYHLTLVLKCFKFMTGYATSWPGPWKVISPPRFVFLNSAPSSCRCSISLVGVSSLIPGKFQHFLLTKIKVVWSYCHWNIVTVEWNVHYSVAPVDKNYDDPNMSLTYLQYKQAYALQVGGYHSWFVFLSPLHQGVF